jgi:hypothetical protein
VNAVSSPSACGHSGRFGRSSPAASPRACSTSGPRSRRARSAAPVPTRVLQAIASGALGRAAYDGGLASALVGLLSHFTVATGAATVFVLMARRVPWLLRAPWVSGPVFGIGVWAAMRFVVLPLSAFPHVQPSDPEAIATALLIHVLFVGLPIAFAVRASAGRPTFHSTPGDHA